MKEMKIPEEIIKKIESLLSIDGPAEVLIVKNHLGTVNFSFTEKCQLKMMNNDK
ncbi:MAG: hypothetical protein JXM74_04610 [Fusobacteriaceae bacterium]|nr:hypothetical protein [Fusobacteriaceae bacterium]MBN2838017.1 hypothetical protein [Fusobacteriaceae bacterium]